MQVPVIYLFLRSLIKLKISGANCKIFVLPDVYIIWCIFTMAIYSYPLTFLVEIYVAALGGFAFVSYVVSVHLNL